MDSSRKNILIVDDEAKILEVVSDYLKNCGYHVFTAEDGLKAMDVFGKENISLIILDLMLPGLSGEEVCKRIRMKSRVPIIMLTARAGEENLLNGLGIGADDYITKPFSLKELNGRIKALLRRCADDLIPMTVKNSFQDGDLIVDFEQNLVKKKQQEVSLTPTELNILSALIKYPGKVFTREELIALVLGPDYLGFDRAVDSHIKNLRQKIEDNPREPVYVQTIHGKGYRFGGV